MTGDDRRTGAVTEVATGVYVLRQPVLDVNAVLVVGDGAALVVDTLSTAAQAGEFARAAREVTDAPWTIVNTHHHFDHCFGNATLADGADIWAHEATAVELRERGAHWQRIWYEEWQEREPGLAAELAEVTIVPPSRTVHTEATLDVGGRRVVLYHFGRGHTEGDLVVHVPDADVVLAGDLVEQGAAPDFGDGYPLEWPDALAALLRLTTARTVVVPGHGRVVDQDFVRAQHADLSDLEWLIRDGHRDGATVEAVAARSPFGARHSLVAVRRGYAELDGRA
ncbi:MAG TPA: MBL fold metallo-hydrolase [Micromonosporaceae bacterium]